MKGKIYPGGNLVIQRAGEYKEALCPFDISGNIVCGDWCALFHEPVKRKTFTELSLCKRVYSFEELEDLRSTNNNN